MSEHHPRAIHRAPEPSHGTSGEWRFTDLIDELGLTFDLLDDTRAWRERAVYEITLRHHDHVDITTAYQIRLPLELVRKYRPNIGRGEPIRLVLPFTVRSKQLLLNVDFKGAHDNRIALLCRSDIARLQAAYLSHVTPDPDVTFGKATISNV